MKFLKVLLAFLLIGVILFLIVTALLPKSYNVSKEYTILAPVDTVYKHISDYKKWDTWSPWARMDSTAVYSYSNPSAGVGSIMSWESGLEEDGIGKGRMTTTNAIVNQELQYELSFEEPMKSQSQGGFYLEGDSTQTRVKWYDQGAAKWPMGRVFGVLMETFIGEDFERGLHNLDSVCMDDMRVRSQEIERARQEANAE